MAYPAPLPLEDLFGQQFLPCSFPQVSVAYSVWPSDAKDTAKTGVDKALDLLVYCLGCTPRFTSVQQHRLDIGIENS